uniref:Uncharacterized protein n=1 Tax=Anguilla anguilla TaxID=7936 RepID=A0A0E9TYA7_ANGAN
MYNMYFPDTQAKLNIKEPAATHHQLH